MQTQQILIVEDDVNASKVIARILEKEGYCVDCTSSAEKADILITKKEYNLLIIDMILPSMDGLSFLKHVKKKAPHILTVIVTAYGSINTAVESLKAGADDFLEKPLVLEKLLHVLRKVFEEQRLKNEIVALRSDLVKRSNYSNIIGKHPKMQMIFQLIESLKNNDAAVLVTGETGTGKELAARAIHFQGHRQHHPFVAINCASIPETLFESELFGFEQGAFTGAVKRKLGKLEQAQGGTVLLDEIGDMPISVQGKLLRSLQEKKIERLGNSISTAVPLDIRIISATNKDLESEVSLNNFRIDLYYRLNVMHLHLPPLRERIEDIPLLTEYFLSKIAREQGKQPPKISRKALSELMSHSWPGNVRELKNVLERTLILNNRQKIIDDIPFLSKTALSGLQETDDLVVDPELSLKKVGKKALTKVEIRYLSIILKKYKGSIKHTADHAGIDARTVRRKMKTYGLDKWAFK